jgi:ribosomal protein S18 acetylase RimI-like enzyme
MSQGPATVASVEYRELPPQQIERLRPLWQKLNSYHASVSPHFSRDFQGYTFDEQKRRLLNDKSRLYILVAENDREELVGYAVGSMNEGANTRGELDSMYVEEAYRGSGIGEELATEILNWFDRHGVDNVIIAVATGNERALKFYERLGFVPRAYTLRRKPDPEA